MLKLMKVSHLQRNATRLTSTHGCSTGPREPTILSYCDIPEPKSSMPLIGTSLDYTPLRGFQHIEFYSHLRKRHEELGEIYKENILPGLTSSTVFCCTPEDTKTLLRNETRFPFREPIGYILKLRNKFGLSSGITQVNGEQWYKMRKVVNQHFLSQKSVWHYTEKHYQIAEELADFIERSMDSNQEVPDFELALKRWSLEQAAIFILDARLGLFDEANKDSNDFIVNVGKVFQCMGDLQIGIPLWMLYETKLYKKYEEAWLNVFHHVKEYRRKAEERHQHKNSESQLQKFLRTSNLGTSEVDMVMNDFLTAGIDTTANSTIFPLYLLAINPEKQEKLREEILRYIQNEPLKGKTLNQLPYLRACLQETQRMFPFVALSSRKYEKDIVLSNYRVPAGVTIMNTSNIMNNMNSKYFDKPESFRPERWLEPEERNKARFAMSGSFGHGPRKCPGRLLALQEMNCLIAVLLSRFRIEYHHRPIEGKFRLLTIPSEKARYKFVKI